MASLLAGCISEQDMAELEKVIAEFHARQAAGEDEAILAAATPAFRNQQSEGDLARLTATVRKAPGCDAPARDPWNYSSNFSTAGSFVTLTYVRKCEGGPIVESFLLRLGAGTGRVEGYSVSGMGLFPT